jgi:cyclopropane fatty-acyl-phospholipid synthase-like methyltransferase
MEVSVRSRTLPPDSVVPREGYGELMSDAFHERYETGRDSWTAEEAMTTPVRVLKAELPAGHVLDVGAGKGRDVECLLAAGYRVTGLDLHEPVEWSALRSAWADRVTLARSSLLAWTGTPVDAVLDNGCFHHQHPDDYATYLAKVHACLAPGGVLVISVFTPYRKERRHGYYTQIDAGRLNRYFTQRELATMLAKSGFLWQRGERIFRPSCHRFYLVGVARRA